MPWAVRAPALLLIAVVGSSPGVADGSTQSPSSPSPLHLSHQVLSSHLLLLQRRRPSGKLLTDAPDAVTNLCTAVELVSKRLLTVNDDWQGLLDLLVALVVALGGAVSDLCSGVVATAAEASAEAAPVPHRTAPAPQLQQPPPPLAGGALSGALSPLAVVAATEAAAAALAALYASCRQIGVAAAAAVASETAAAAGAGADADAGASSAARRRDGGLGEGKFRPGAAAALAAITEHLHNTAATAARAAATAEVAASVAEAEAEADAPNSSHSLAGHWAPGRTLADSRVTVAFAAAAAAGLLEGCGLTVRLQPLGRPQELLLRVLQPGTDALTAALREAAAAAAAACATATVAASLQGDRTYGAADAAGPVGFARPRRSASICALDADPWVALLGMSVGYGWCRLRAQASLPGLRQPALRAADQMVVAVAAVTRAAAATEGPAGPASAAGPAGPPSAVTMEGASTSAGGPHPCYLHPCCGAMAMLLIGSLGVGRVLQLAVAGGQSEAAAELLDEISRGPLAADTQLLAKAVVEALRAAAPPPGAAAPAPPAPRAPLARVLLYDAAAAARRLNMVYGSVADSVAGRAALAALPTAATGAVRELLDRTFVCEVSVMAAAYDSLAAPRALEAATALALPRLPGTRPHAATALEAGESKAVGVEAAPPTPVAAAAAALGALADLQFCALQLRAHGDLVARLSADAAAAPAVALPPLLTLLPCYSAFGACYAGGGAAGGARFGFAAAPVAASRLAFLLPLAASCVPHADDVGSAAATVLPYIYLLLKGAPESVGQAAHSTWAALLAGLCGERNAIGSKDASSGAIGVRGGGERSHFCGGSAPVGRGRGGQAALVAEKEEQERRSAAAALAIAANLVPYYLERTFQEPCDVSDMELLEWGLRQVLQSLPECHPMKAWCVARVVRQLRLWATAPLTGRAATVGPTSVCPTPAPGTAAQSPRAGGVRGTGNATRELEDAAAVDAGKAPWPTPPPAAMVTAEGPAMAVNALARRGAAAVGLAVSLLDYPLLPAALQALDEALQGLTSRPDALGEVLQQLHDVWLPCSDYGRRPLLESWLRRWLARPHVRARL